MSSLEQNLNQQIKKDGPITFAAFMESALYHAEHGYYVQNAQSPDYYTNVDVHPLFGQLLARYFYQEWQENFTAGEPFQIVELGSGNGKLAQIILKYLTEIHPEWVQNLSYICVERSLSRRSQGDSLRSQLGYPIQTKSDFDFEDNGISGIVFSNEFFDALPFHRFKKQDGKIQEIFIDTAFREVLEEPSPAVRDYLQWLGAEPPEGCIAEAQIECKNWMQKMVQSLKKGVILSIDYGCLGEELYSESRPEGTALCLKNNQTNRRYYEDIGFQDITAHVNFTALLKIAEECGIQNQILRTQSKFFLESGMNSFIETLQNTQDPVAYLKTTSAIKTLIHPEGLGGTFKCLTQRKH